jgi:hypothetical protein
MQGKPKTVTLTLRRNGPDPDVIHCDSGDTLKIVNEAGKDTVVLLDNPGVFNPSPGNTIPIAKDATATKHVGSNGDCDYAYITPGASQGVRNGQIRVP